jgi:hypothetical protein
MTVRLARAGSALPGCRARHRWPFYSSSRCLAAVVTDEPSRSSRIVSKSSELLPQRITTRFDPPAEPPQRTTPVLTLPRSLHRGSQPALTLPRSLHSEPQPALTLPRSLHSGPQPALTLPRSLHSGPQPALTLPSSFQKKSRAPKTTRRLFRRRHGSRKTIRPSLRARLSSSFPKLRCPCDPVTSRSSISTFGERSRKVLRLNRRWPN